MQYLVIVVIVGPAFVCARYPSLALLVAGLLALCVRFERKGDGRWRWLAAAAVAWATFGMRELFIPGAPPNWKYNLRRDLIVIAPVLWILTGIAVLRAGGALSRPWPIALRILAVALIVAPVLGAGLIGLDLAREAVYPWTDWSAPHAVLHVSNESAADVRVTWQWEGEVPHRVWIGGDGVISPHDYWLDMILVMPLAGETWPGNTPRELVLFVEPHAGDGRVLERKCIIGPDQHLRVRINSSGDVFTSSGDESWIGAPRFDDEVALAAD